MGGERPELPDTQQLQQSGGGFPQAAEYLELMKRCWAQDPLVRREWYCANQGGRSTAVPGTQRMFHAGLLAGPLLLGLSV